MIFRLTFLTVFILTACQEAPSSEVILETQAVITKTTQLRFRRRQGAGCFVEVTYQSELLKQDVSATFAERQACGRFKNGKTVTIQYRADSPTEIEFVRF